ncbi:MAG TPA: hypothetical protein VGM81_02720 [Burkholderiaceae bacterium]|jgi:hypothetical protein
MEQTWDEGSQSSAASNRAPKAPALSRISHAKPALPLEDRLAVPGGVNLAHLLGGDDLSVIKEMLSMIRGDSL